ncbi:MAG: nucleotidyl transferase AbiEii/AbiGii toxin family protein [Euryarchaeota archaeon]|nr:nucleotidyl transferase AbiEii/AbiGii toxin family protein [Euryarchaeota archaeon]
MIKKDELKRIADAKRLSVENAETDYLLELLLFYIYTEFGDLLILKGGTALYKIYNLNRFSEDLDFTLHKRRFDLTKFLNKTMRSLSLIGVGGKAEVEKYRNEINVRLQFKGPLYDGSKESLCFISLNISLRERVAKELRKEMIFPAYREIPSFDIFVMNETEIMAEKVRAIMTRNKARDVYDLWFLLKRGVRPERSLIDKKLKIYKMKFSFDAFVESVEEKKAFWNTDLRGLVVGELVEFGRVKKDVVSAFSRF